jgi:hypothetical protein
MAAGIQQSGAQLHWASFPDDRWHKINTWEVDGDGIVSLYRKGDALRYRFQADGIDYQKSVEGESVQSSLAQIEDSIPVRRGDQVEFVQHQYPSILDATKKVTQDIWAVTMISQLGTSGNSTCLIGGHAYIMIEGINELKKPFRLAAEISTLMPSAIPKKYIEVPHNRAIPRLQIEDKFRLEWPRSDTFLRSKELVMTMITHVQQQIDATFAEVEEGRPHIIRFNGMSPIPEENIHNCLSWDLQELAICNITIPLTEPPLPGSGWYIPRYHIQSYDTICKRIIKQGDLSVEEYAQDGDLEEIRHLERRVEKSVQDVKGSLATGGICLGMSLAPPLWFLTPVILVGTPIATAVYGYKSHQAKKDLQKKKIEVLRKCYQV